MFQLVIEVEGHAPALVLVQARDPMIAIQGAAVEAAPAPAEGESERTTRVRVTMGDLGDSVLTVVKRLQGAPKLGAGGILTREHPTKIIESVPFATVDSWKGYNPLTAPEGRLSQIRELVDGPLSAEEKIAGIKAALDGVDPTGPTHLTPIRYWKPGIWLIVGGNATYIRTLEADNKLEDAQGFLDGTLDQFVKDARELILLMATKLPKDQRSTAETARQFCNALTKLRLEKLPTAKAYGAVVRAARDYRLLHVDIRGSTTGRAFAEVLDALERLLKGKNDGSVCVQGEGCDSGGGSNGTPGVPGGAGASDQGGEAPGRGPAVGEPGR